MMRSVTQFSALVIVAIFVFQYVQSTKQVRLVQDKFENEIQTFKQASFLNQYYDINVVTVTVIDKLGITVMYILSELFDVGCLIFLIFSTPLFFILNAFTPFLPFLIILQVLQN